MFGYTRQYYAIIYSCICMFDAFICVLMCLYVLLFVVLWILCLLRGLGPGPGRPGIPLLPRLSLFFAVSLSCLLYALHLVRGCVSEWVEVSVAEELGSYGSGNGAWQNAGQRFGSPQFWNRVIPPQNARNCVFSNMTRQFFQGAFMKNCATKIALLAKHLDWPRLCHGPAMALPWQCHGIAMATASP